MKRSCSSTRLQDNSNSRAQVSQPLTNSPPYLTHDQMNRINSLVREIEKLSDVEKLLLYLQLPGGSPSDSEVARSKAKSGSNPFGKKADREITQTYTWILSHLEEDPNVSLPKQEVYDEYRAFCLAHSLEPLCVADFGKAMKHAFPRVKPRRLGQRGNSRYCYSGLRKKFRIQAPTLPDIGQAAQSPSNCGHNMMDSSNGDCSGMSSHPSSAESSVAPPDNNGILNNQQGISMIDSNQLIINNVTLNNSTTSAADNFIDSHSNDSTCDMTISRDRMLTMSIPTGTVQMSQPHITKVDEGDASQRESKRRKRSVSQRKNSLTQEMHIKRSPSQMADCGQVSETNHTMPLDSIEPTFCMSNDCSPAVNQLIMQPQQSKRPAGVCDPTVNGFCDVSSGQDSYMRTSNDVPDGIHCDASMVRHAPPPLHHLQSATHHMDVNGGSLNEPTSDQMNGRINSSMMPSINGPQSGHVDQPIAVHRQPAFTDPRLSQHLSQMGSLCLTPRYSPSSENFRQTSTPSSSATPSMASYNLTHQINTSNLADVMPERAPQYGDIYNGTSGNGVQPKTTEELGGQVAVSSPSSLSFIAYGPQQPLSTQAGTINVHDYQQFHHSNHHLNSMCSPFVSPRSSPNSFMNNPYHHQDYSLIDDHYND